MVKNFHSFADRIGPAFAKAICQRSTFADDINSRQVKSLLEAFPAHKCDIDRY